MNLYTFTLTIHVTQCQVFQILVIFIKKNLTFCLFANLVLRKIPQNSLLDAVKFILVLLIGHQNDLTTRYLVSLFSVKKEGKSWNIRCRPTQCALSCECTCILFGSQ